MIHMFIRYFVEIPRMMTEVENDLLASPAEVLSGPARDAESRGDRLLAEVGWGASPARISTRVELRVGHPIRFPSKTVLPVSWRPAFLEALIPNLDADIELGELGPERTQLSISARYTPPLGQVGVVLDRALLHRVAEATVKDFLDRVAERLSRSTLVVQTSAIVDVGTSSA
jgi:hypothetical protein